MRFILAAQLYWPIWLAFCAYRHPYLGMLVASIATAAAMALVWRLTFGSFRGMFGGKLPSRHP